MSLNFNELRYANRLRNSEWAGDVALSLAFRGNELAGEVGEACNIIKKLERANLGLKGSKADKNQLAEELADVIMCVDLIAMDLGIDMSEAVRSKFNKTSVQRYLKTRL